MMHGTMSLKFAKCTCYIFWNIRTIFTQT